MLLSVKDLLILGTNKKFSKRNIENICLIIKRRIGLYDPVTGRGSTFP